MSELTLEQWPLNQLIPYVRNPRKNDEQVDRMAAAIREFGFRVPVLAQSDGTVVDGHLRLKAANKLGMESIPVILADGLTPAQVKAFRLLANRSVNWAEWDTELLSLELNELKDLDFDLNLTGFDDDELANLLDNDGDDDQLGLSDKIPEHTGNIITNPGDIWRLGRHFVMCGDSSNPNNIQKLLNGCDPELLIYDPPYDVDESWAWAWPTPKAIVFTDYKYIRQAMMVAAHYDYVYQFIWDGVTSWYTPNRPLARHKSALFCAHDPFWDFDASIYRDDKQREAKVVSNTRGQCDYHPLPNGGVHLQTIFQHPNTQVEGKHAHAKPVQWMRALLSGTATETALDLFGGSGTSIMAAPEKMTVYAMELLPINVDVIVKRYEESTGVRAERINDAAELSMD